MHIHPSQNQSVQPRRGFLKESLALAIGGITSLIPFLSGLTVLLDPLRRKSGAGGPVYVAPLGSLPENGEPQKFPVLATREDAWNRAPNTPVGAVYLRRTAAGVAAFNAMCPHAGCFIDYSAERKCFKCPCHNSEFKLDGQRTASTCPSPRAMDELVAEVRKDEVWVRFQNFRAGDKDKIPV
jgi:menaquinol-cytochrome c reductase iron-sulfur subunit